MTEWNIQSRARACTACNHSFVHQEHYHTLLFEERAQLNRSDLCQTCWEKDYSDGSRSRKGFVSYWQGVYEAPTPPVEAIQKENAESLLRKLFDLNDPHYIPAAYILAVMLERKRLLKVKEEILRDGQRIFIYEHPRTGDVYTIIDPNLQLNQLEAVQRDVASLLEHGLPVQSAPAEPAAGNPAGAGQATDANEAAAPTPPSPEAASTSRAESAESVQG